MLGVRLLLRGVQIVSRCRRLQSKPNYTTSTVEPFLAAHFCRQLAPIRGPAVILKMRRVNSNGNHKEQRGLETPVYDYGLQGVHYHNIPSVLLAVAPRTCIANLKDTLTDFGSLLTGLQLYVWLQLNVEINGSLRG